ncbi:MAG: DUF2478 domain-containing protein [Hyphomicrobiales bacterium]
MRIGYLQGGRRTDIQSTLWGFARDLISSGHRVAGMVERPAALKRDSLLADVASDVATCIFQDLGSNAQSCALDVAALTEASGLVEAAVTGETELLILSKFGKLESEGGGFRGAITKALLLGVPVLTSVNPQFDAEWQDFTGGMAMLLPLEAATLRAWWQN